MNKNKMTQEEILEFNKRCAKFLGSELKNDGQFDYWTYDHLGFDSMKISGSAWVSGNFEFHSDWNWIMEVVEAIEKLNSSKFYVSILENECEIIDKEAASNEENPFMIKPIAAYTESESKKEAVIQAINQFLVWYNEKI